MAQGVRLIGGRYDGLLFAASDGWTPGADVGALYLSLPNVNEFAAAAELRGDAATTALVNVPFTCRARHDPFDATLHGAQVYLRCSDGLYRTPKLAAACNVNL